MPEEENKKIPEGSGPAEFFHHQLKAHYSTKRIIAIIGGTGSGKCVAENEELLLADGSRIVAKDLVETQFKVLTIDEGGFVEVDAYAQWAETEEVFQLLTESGRRFVRNGAHPFYKGIKEHWSVNNRSMPAQSIGFTPLRELSVGDLIAVPSVLPFRAEGTMNEDEVKVLAYLIGDGSTLKNITFCQQNNRQLQEFKECIDRLGAEARKYPTADKYTYQIVAKGINGPGWHKYYPNPIIKLVEKHDLRGCDSYTKRVPGVIFKLNNELVATFLSRLYSTDGCASFEPPSGPNNKYTHSKITYTSNSVNLLIDIQALLLRFGINSRMKHAKCSILELCEAEDKIKFADRIGIYGKEFAVEKVKKQAQSVWKTRTWRSNSLPDGLKWEKIKAINSKGIQRTVAVTVPGPSTFLSMAYEKNTWYAPYWIVTKRLVQPNSQLLAIGLSYQRHVIRVMVKRMEDFLRNWKIPYQMNLSTATLTLKTNNSQVLFGSAENALSLEGSHLEGGAWLDECGQMPRVAYDVAERRTNLHKAPILMTSVPYYLNWLKTDVYDPYLEGKRTDVEWIHTRSLDNLSFDPEMIEEIKARRRPEYFQIYFEGNFTKPFGLIYDDPSSEDIIVDPEVEFPNGIPSHWPSFSGHDFGMNDPNAALWARLDPVRDILYIVAEYEAPSLTMRAHIERWKQAGLEVDAAFGDPSGADQMATADELGYPIQKSNNDILAGIDLVYDRFKTGRLRVFPNCKTFIDHRESYVWAKNSNDEDELLDKPANPQPARHMMDALRYLVIGLQENFMMLDERAPVVITRRRQIQTHYG